MKFSETEKSTYKFIQDEVVFIEVYKSKRYISLENIFVQGGKAITPSLFKKTKAQADAIAEECSFEGDKSIYSLTEPEISVIREELLGIDSLRRKDPKTVRMFVRGFISRYKEYSKTVEPIDVQIENERDYFKGSALYVTKEDSNGRSFIQQVSNEALTNTRRAELERLIISAKQSLPEIGTF